VRLDLVHERLSNRGIADSSDRWCLALAGKHACLDCFDEDVAEWLDAWSMDWLVVVLSVVGQDSFVVGYVHKS